MPFRPGIVTFLLLTLLLPCATNVSGKDWSEESKADRNARMQWWREARFGMFIHWGLYAIPAGKWDGTFSLSNKNDWDLAAAHLLVQEAGGKITTHTGGAIRYNRASPRQQSVVAAGPALHAALVERTKTARI